MPYTIREIVAYHSTYKTKILIIHNIFLEK